MMKPRLLSLVLVLLILGGLLPIFASCGSSEDGIVSLSRKTVDVDLTDYTLVYGDSQRGEAYTATFRDRMNDLGDMLSVATGEKFVPYTMARTQTTAADKEILVGLTKREESAELLDKIKGDGFAIEVTENKVVMVGTSNLFTMMAVDYFIDTYLKPAQEKNPVLSLHKKATADQIGTVTLATNEAAAYTYVYQDGMGTVPPGFAGTDHATLANSTYKEYAQVAIDEIVEEMNSITGLRNKYFPIKTDKETYEREVLVGPVGNEESKTLLNTISEDECIIAVVGEDVILNAWSEAALAVATPRYLDIIKEGTQKGSDGSVAVVLPRQFRYTARVDAEWVLDFPRPDTEGLSLYNTMDAGDGLLQFLYMGEGATPAAHKAYCDKLKGEGYTVYMDNTIEGSIYTTLVNKSENVMLYVAYNAYAHREEYDTEYDWVRSKKDTKDVGYYEYDPAIRVVSGPLDASYLASERYTTKQTYTKVTDSSVTTMPLYGQAVGLIYVIRLEDGRFIVFDGGNTKDGGTDYDVLWDTLCYLYAETNDGAKPTRAKPIRLASWIVTHPHPDHYRVFKKMVEKYGPSGMLKIDTMIANLPDEHSAYPVRAEGKAISLEEIANLQDKVGGFEFIKVHTGQRLYFANLEIEVLATWEDLNPFVINDGNDTNSVFRFSIRNQDAPEAAPIVQLWVGDAQRWVSRYLCATYGDYLRADMMSVGHHGNVGCEIDLYDTVRPTAIWWPHNASAIRHYLNAKYLYRGYQFEADQYFAKEIPEVKYIFASGGANEEDGPYTTVMLTVNGPDYENAYDAKTGERVEYSLYDGENSTGLGACIQKP